MIPDHEEEQDGQGQKEVEEVGDDRDGGQDLRREQDFFQQPAAAHQNRGGLENRRLEKRPGKDAAGEEEEIGLHLLRSLAGQHVAEYDAVGEEIQQGIDETPDEAQNAPPVTRFELARDKALDEGPVTEERFNLSEDLRPRAQAPLVWEAAERRATAFT